MEIGHWKSTLTKHFSINERQNGKMNGINNGERWNFEKLYCHTKISYVCFMMQIVSVFIFEENNPKIRLF